jgi:HD-GYP domain-containing protein (c-di-GMP phosphodiesterase class II)
MRDTLPNRKYANFSSIEDASILTKFTVLFLLMSIIPLSLLWYIYIQLRESGQITLEVGTLRITLVWVVMGIVVGYLAMRSVLQKLIHITRANQQTLEVVLGPQKIRELSEEKNEIAVLARSFTAITTRLEENVRNLELAKRTLHSVLSKVGDGISSMQNIDNFLELIVETVVDAFSGKAGFLWLKGSDGEFQIKTLFGLSIPAAKKIRLKETQEPLASLLKSKKTMILFSNDLKMDNGNLRQIFRPPILCAPLMRHNEVIGLIGVCDRPEELGRFMDDEVNLMNNLALQTAVAIENSKLSEDAEKTYFETISALALAVDAKDKYSRGHLDRVAGYVVRIAEKLGLDEKQKKVLRDAARLHDVGKIGVPDEILTKPGKLADHEIDMMKKHPEIGESIVRPIRSLRDLCDIIRHHHEKLDGSGYPDGLKGDEITLLVRITAVADIFDALTTDRPYRGKFSQEQAFKELRLMQGKLDQNIVEQFIETFVEHGSTR